MTSEINAVILPVTAFRQNCTLVWCTKTMRGAIIDPGGEVSGLAQAAAEREVEVERILLTHGHLDHAGGAAALSEQLGIPIEGPHRADKFLLDALGRQGVMFGLSEARPVAPNRWLEDSAQVSFGHIRLEVLHCPGHTPGHVVFFHRPSRVAFVGDVLFKGSIGRTDFPRGDHAALIASIRDKLWPLGDDVTFVPGHGPLSTFGEERRTNPFVADARA